jgi:hypothetical protein
LSVTEKERVIAEMERKRKQSELEHNRQYDDGKAGILGCDGAYEPESRLPHGALRPGKTYEDRLPVDKRRRVIEAQKRAERMRG